MAREPTAIGCNIFAGGFTLGVRSRFRVLGHLEHDEFGVATMRANQPEVPVYVGPETWPDPEPGPDLVYANPPCAIWSTAGTNHGNNLDDPRLQRLYDAYALLERYRPRVWVWESVPQAQTKGWRIVRELIAGAERLGYRATVLLQNARHLGVPQQRSRFMLVLRTVEVDWFEGLRWDAAPTAGEVLEGVEPDPRLQPNLPSHEKELWKDAPFGGRLQAVFNQQIGLEERERLKAEHGKVKGRPGFMRRRLDPEDVSPAAIGGQLCHPHEPRFLAANELGVLCGYPADYRWVGSSEGASDQVCRAVCPPVAEWFAHRVADALERGEPARAHEHVDLRKEPGDRHAFRLDEE